MFISIRYVLRSKDLILQRVMFSYLPQNKVKVSLKIIVIVIDSGNKLDLFMTFCFWWDIVF